MTSSWPEWATFKQWSVLGYQIIKGSKATWFENVPKFSKNQVKEYSYRTREYDDYDEYEDARAYRGHEW